MKKKNLLQELLFLGVTLTIICVIVGGIVAFVYETTKEQIAMNNKINAADLAIVMPESDSIEDVTTEFEVNDYITEVYKALKGSDVVGYVYKTTTSGYKPGLSTLIGLDNEGNVVAAKISQSSETPGLGALVAEDKFISQFAGKETASEFQIVKTEPAGADEIQAVSGATISSTAVASSVNEAVKFHKKNILGEEVVEAPKAEPTIENMRLTGDEMVETPGELKTFEVKTAGAVTGYIVYASNPGYYEDKPITVAVSFDAAAKQVKNIMVVEQNETQGIGTKISEEGFAQLFQDKPSEEMSVQVYSGASESSKGVFKAVNKAILYFNDVLMQGGN